MPALRRELDPLADVISFGVAAYVGAVDERLWLGDVEIAGFRLHWLALLYAASGSLMTSRIRIPKI